MHSQGSSNLSVLTETGIRQAERCKRALANIHFDRCFSSPISRAKVGKKKYYLLLLLKVGKRILNLLLLNAFFKVSILNCLMQSTAEIVWQGREEPLVFIDSLKEAHLFHLEGMKNGLSPCV